jgi:2-polyprenyl-6-methoxyphenol hydroxylase-like FAD-dependent oxidoreductase
MAAPNNNASPDVPVLIVGGGPVGMVLALNLEYWGVRSMVVNSDPRPRWHPKGNTHNSRTMEHYRRLGISKKIRSVGLPEDYPTDVGYFTRFVGWELARLDMPSEREKAATAKRAATNDQVLEAIFRCNQMYVEQALFDHMTTLADIDVRFGWQLLDCTDHGSYVTASLEEVATGKQTTVTCSYLIGCDGSQSVVRKKLGIRYSGGGPRNTEAYLDGPMVSTYLRAPDFYNLIKAPPCWQYRAVNAEVVSNTTALDGRGEFVMNSRLKTADETPDDRKVIKAFLTSAGVDMPVEVLAHSTWTGGRALVAEQFGKGRVLMAGDSVHLFTPAGGFGMNTGVDDTSNLGWKLAAVLQGWGGPRLLDSYEQERKPIATRNTKAAQSLGLKVADSPIGPDIEKDSEAGAKARQVTGEYLSRFRPEFDSLGVQLGARYDGSSIVATDGSSPPPDDPEIYVPSACPGGRAPHVWMQGHGSSLFDHFGRGFTLLNLGGSSPDAMRPLTDAAAKRNLPLKVLDVPAPEARDLYERKFTLIRPDQYVAWRGDRLPDNCDPLLAQVSGW